MLGNPLLFPERNSKLPCVYIRPLLPPSGRSTNIRAVPCRLLNADSHACLLGNPTSCLRISLLSLEHILPGGSQPCSGLSTWEQSSHRKLMGSLGPVALPPLYTPAAPSQGDKPKACITCRHFLASYSSSCLDLLSVPLVPTHWWRPRLASNTKFLHVARPEGHISPCLTRPSR